MQNYWQGLRAAGVLEKTATRLESYVALPSRCAACLLRARCAKPGASQQSDSGLAAVKAVLDIHQVALCHAGICVL